MEKLTKTSGENNSAMEYECEKYIAPECKNADFLTRVQGDYYVCPDPTSLKVTTRTTKIGNTYTTTSSINRDILGWYNFYSIYPISKELYNLIKDNGIEEVAVEGVAPIIIK